MDGVNRSASPSSTGENFDLVIDSKNSFGPQTVVREFQVAAGVTAVRLRYRLQTAEYTWPSPKNDAFHVEVRNLTTGVVAVDSETVSSLAPDFIAHYATAWRELSVPATGGSIVRITLTVANAEDSTGPSWIFADLVAQPEYRIERVQFRDLIHAADPHAALRPDKPISQLSASPHQSYEGYVRLHGRIKIIGEQADSLTAVEVQVRTASGAIIATGQLARLSTGSNIRTLLLGVPFGEDRQIEVSPEEGTDVTPLMFEIASHQFDTVDQETAQNMELVVQATTASGITIGPTGVGAFEKVVRFTGQNRAGAGRDLADCTGLKPSDAPVNQSPFPCGGDSWSEPRVRSWALNRANVQWNDFSNMNGGFFPPHEGHREGRTIDGLTPGYLNMDANAAQALIDMLNERNPEAVERVFVSFSIVNADCRATRTPLPGNEYYQVLLKSKVGTRPATAVIQNLAGHCDHFDILIDPRKVK
jgi:hypothetical protein